MTETENQPEDCPRCGSLLPDADEGLCPTCGYEFGRATLYMPVVRLDQIDDDADLPEGVLDGPPAAAVTAPSRVVGVPPPMAAPKDPDGRKVLVVVLAVIVLFVLGLIGAAFILLFSAVDGDSVEGPPPATFEQPAESE